MKKYIPLIILLVLKVNTFALQSASAKPADQAGEYEIMDNILITTRDGAVLSGMMARKRGDVTPKPVILQHTIYVRDKGRDLRTIKVAADNGYVGVITYSRGKRYSPDEIFPYENEANDSYDVIDWISRQEWCNGSIGMYGGSYNGFTQWAACKTPHPALKTIVPYVAARPGNGLPMENNVFINPNYEWSFYVGNNKYLDTAAGNDRQRFRRMQFRWWELGVAYNKMDSIDGTPNKWFQRWISHPAFDTYWQQMTPYQDDFARIKIPILAFEGYYNDGQNSGLYYLREMQKYSPETPVYLIIGPYGHFGTQKGGESVLYDYKVDSVALFDITAITYQWFDYILKNGAKPAILKNKINYEVMGANEWGSAQSIDDMSNNSMTLYLTSAREGRFYAADSEIPGKTDFLVQEVDFTDREISNNNYYPDPIIRQEIDTTNGFYFLSDPLEEPILVNGSFSGEINASINKKDMDIGVTIYELLPDGKYFHLSYFIGRASYALDNTQRQLLQPNTKTNIPFSNTHLISKQLSKGSRILIHLNINKNPFSEINYGTGKTVTEENINDAKELLRIKWYNDSFVKIPVWE